MTIEPRLERLELLLADMDRLNQKVLGFDGNGLYVEDLRALIELVRGILPRPIEEAPKEGRFLAYWNGWEQVSRYDEGRYFHVESLPDHSNEEPIDQFTGWLSFDALPLPSKDKTDG